MTLFQNFKSQFDQKLVQRRFLKKGHYYVCEKQDVREVIGFQRSKFEDGVQVLFRLEVALTYVNVLSCRGLVFKDNFMNSHFSKTSDSCCDNKGWIVLKRENQIVDLVNSLTRELDTLLLPQLAYYNSSDNFFNYLKESYKRHPIFSNEMAENLFCFSKLYKPGELFDVFQLVLSKVDNKFDEEFVNHFIKEIDSGYQA